MVNWSKPIRTREGSKARLLGEIEGASGLRRVVAVTYKSSDDSDKTYEVVQKYYNSGNFLDALGFNRSKLDVENVPEEKVVYYSIYKNVLDGPFLSKEEATLNTVVTAPSRLCLLKITYEGNVIVKREVFE